MSFQTTALKSCFMHPPGAILAPGERLSYPLLLWTDCMDVIGVDSSCVDVVDVDTRDVKRKDGDRVKWPWIP
ncbi:unnamed protein product [Eruca vesicaria subsp. sativa]|uniref:Uncharacterized protein n=1 Tax=Eruca vesicaria subsp. sativa TaxID=29727 RepID=A0ABC8L4I2_ERUVS|nr:unnamed protein product [Eruca vesicaria subsp. sativa]